VVEDERSMLATLRRGLEAEGYVVDVAEEGPVALWMATEFDYDALVLDVMLPGMNGFVVAQKLRESGRHMPIVILTAVDGHLVQADALDAGADDYLTKPFSFEVLLARLRAVTRRAAGHSSSELRSGDLSLDLTSRRVERAGSRIELTAREYALLEYLLLHGGDVVSKSELLRHVWEDDVGVTPNAVEVYVGYLRRKIDAPFGVQSLETIRGTGYRLNPVVT
jgi:DNA-binding response OmpR family regulator